MHICFLEPPVTTAQHSVDEEVIAENYDEMDEPATQTTNADDYQYPSQYDLDHDTVRKPVEDNNWLAQMKTRMGEANSTAGYKCCPNKYNIWHKCTLYCVNRWSEGIPKPSAEYMKRYKRLIRKYPLPKGWVEMYDPGCGVYYFACEADNVVSWLPPTHPKSEVTKCAAAVRRQMEESSGDAVAESDVEDQSDNDGENNIKESAQSRHHREVDEIINASMRSKSPRTGDSHEFPTLQEMADSPSVPLPRKQKSRDLDRVARQRRERDRDRDRGNDRDRERDRDRRDRDRDRGGDRYSSYNRRRQRDDSDILDPMDPSAYSDIPRGKWADGLQTGGGSDERKKRTDDSSSKRDKGSSRDMHEDSGDDEDDYQ